MDFKEYKPGDVCVYEMNASMQYLEKIEHRKRVGAAGNRGGRVKTTESLNNANMGVYE